MTNEPARSSRVSRLCLIALAGLIMGLVVALAACGITGEGRGRGVTTATPPKVSKDSTGVKSRPDKASSDRQRDSREKPGSDQPPIKRTPKVKDTTTTLGPDRKPKLSMELQAAGSCDEVMTFPRS